jgi:hypothetical protein
MTPNIPSNPIQPIKAIVRLTPQHIISLNGKRYKITQLSVRSNRQNAWQSVDLTKIDQAELEKMVHSCQALFEKNVAPKDFNSTKSFTLYFQQQPEEKPTLINQTLGKRLKKLAWKPQPNQLEKITYLPEGAGQSKSFTINPADYKDEAEQKQLKALLETVNATAKYFYRNFSEPKQLTQPSPAPALTSALEQCLQEPGTKENRCAARAIAYQMLQKPNSLDNLETLDKEAFDKAQTPADKVELVSNALIGKAAFIIATDARFLDTDASPNAPSYTAVLAAGKTIDPDFDKALLPLQVVEKYATLITEPGQMLDLPFFLALDAPFIVLQRNQQNQFYISAMSHNVAFPNGIANLQPQDLADLNVVFYNGTNHYQSVILKTPEAYGELSALFKQELNRWLSELDPPNQNDFLQKTNDIIKLDPTYQKTLEQTFPQSLKIKLTEDNE